MLFVWRLLWSLLGLWKYGNYCGLRDAISFYLSRDSYCGDINNNVTSNGLVMKLMTLVEMVETKSMNNGQRK